MAKKKKDKFVNDTPGQFMALPYAVISSDKFQSCKPLGIKLLLSLFLQYNGTNNGDISCTSTVMQKHGWNNKQQLQTALEALLKSGLLIKTRQGARPKKASLYAFSWIRIHECLQDGKHKLDVEPTKKPLVNFK